MSDVKLVKVDNWGVYFLQKLKHFFNRTDYCDLTLQFQNNAQLKVHRLVLNACTEYFELLERTCEMYEDCLIMPDDLQADVVVPIVNFMYTGQLEFKTDLLESLYQTAQIMNIHVLTKLLDAHRRPRGPPKRAYSKTVPAGTSLTPTNVSTPQKRTYPRTTAMLQSEKKTNTIYKSTSIVKEIPTTQEVSYVSAPKRPCIEDPRPSRYELPEEFEDNLFNSSFTNISYTSEPLTVHPETTKKYPSRKSGIFKTSVSTNKSSDTSTLDIVECKKISSANESLFDEDLTNLSHETEMFTNMNDSSNDRQTVQISNQLFDQILDQPSEGPKITIETKDNFQVNVDHAKIISEVLKKYPHLVKGNKNIKLKILNTPTSKKKGSPQTPTKLQQQIQMIKSEEPDYAFESDVLDSKEAARLIALGADNIRGPWICLICGAPGKALHFKTYYKFRRHLVEVHNEKPISKMCEYCGLKSFKRNYLLHHLYTKHGVPPPATYHFPKCNQCNYVALTDGFLVKHKMSHSLSNHFRCNVCSASYGTSQDLLKHIQATNHKYSSEKEKDLQCIYCLKVFLRHRNLFSHLKAHHKEIAKKDGIIEESDDEQSENQQYFKSEPSFEEDETQYQIEQKPDGNIHIITNRKDGNTMSVQARQRILNTGYSPVKKVVQTIKPKQNEVLLNAEFDFNTAATISTNKNQHAEFITIDNNEYVMKDNRLIPRDNLSSKDEFIISNMMPEESEAIEPSTSMAYTTVNPLPDLKEVTKPSNINQLQIVVSNEEEYKALINSNQTIIFDDVDSNKTLTVLSASNATALNSSAIELDNSSSNNMVVLQDNYQLNVSQAIPTDNNIVVVYSHPVSDKDKQYQLIASQGINQEFVQTSTVLTSSYEPIATSTAVLSAHVIDPNEEVTWQNENLTSVQDTELLKNKNNNELASIEESTGEGISEVHNAFSLLPEVTLTASKQIDESVSMEVNDEIVESADQNIQSETSTTMDEDASVEESATSIDVHNDIVTTENIVENELNVHGDVEIVHEYEQNVHESCIVHESIPLEPEEKVIQEKAQEMCIVEEGIELQTEEPKNEIEEQEELTSDTVTTEQGEETDNITQQHVEVIPTNNEPVIPIQTKEQIESLASEWSDDETEGKENEEEANEQLVVNESLGEMEESIENIQQEMEKQITQSTENSNESVKKVVLNNDGAQKISSLLNDWDDNELLEEKEEVQNVKINDNIASEIPNISKKEVSKKDDKIQCLVKDWEEDEEVSK